MLLRTVLVLAVFELAVGSEQCATLSTMLNLTKRSYNKGSVCHGLFWTGPTGGEICQHDSITKDWCKDDYPVYIAEIIAIVEEHTRPAPTVSDAGTKRIPASATRAGVEEEEVVPTELPADACKELYPGSYRKRNGRCHGLYWTQERGGEFCYHSAGSIDCQIRPGYSVTYEEALGIYQLAPRATTTSRPTRPRRVTLASPPTAAPTPCPEVSIIVY